MFAQELARGENASQAYRNAGFSDNRANACRLQQDERIKQRVAQLLTEKARQHAKASEKAIQKLSISREWVLAKLVENAEGALERKDGSTANRALELLGIEQGMFIKRTESGAPGDFAGLTSADEVIARVRADLGDEAADALSTIISSSKQEADETGTIPLEQVADASDEPALTHDGSDAVN